VLVTGLRVMARFSTLAPLGAHLVCAGSRASAERNAVYLGSVLAVLYDRHGPIDALPAAHPGCAETCPAAIGAAAGKSTHSAQPPEGDIGATRADRRSQIETCGDDFMSFRLFRFSRRRRVPRGVAHSGSLAEANRLLADGRAKETALFFAQLAQNLESCFKPELHLLSSSISK
jgi:hypothetical protein